MSISDIFVSGDTFPDLNQKKPKKFFSSVTRKISVYGGIEDTRGLFVDYFTQNLNLVYTKFYLLKLILSFCAADGTLTSVANPIIWRNLTVYQVISNCHHSSPCRAENSKAWWLLCQPSPNASNATHLTKSKDKVIIKEMVPNSYGILVLVYQLFLDKSPVFHVCCPQTWHAEFTSHVIWYTHTTLTPCNRDIWKSFRANWTAHISETKKFILFKCIKPLHVWHEKIKINQTIKILYPVWTNYCIQLQVFRPTDLCLHRPSYIVV